MMDLGLFISGIKEILFNPVKAWETIYSLKKPVKVVRDSILFPLLILTSASAIVGSLFFINTHLSTVYSLLAGIRIFISVFLTVYASSYIVGEITFPLDLGRNFSVSFRIIVYSIVPFLLCQILSGIFESLQFVNLIGLYGLYIFWTGAEKLLNPPSYKKMPLLIASVFSMVAIYILSSEILRVLIDKIYYKFLS
jgi:hypothetical protein